MRVEEGGRWVLAMADIDAALALARALPANVQALIEVDGLGALTRVKRIMPDVLITDLALPGLDGPELIRRTQMTRLFTLPHAVVLTVSEMVPALDRLSLSDTCVVMVKPIDAQALYERVSALTPGDRLPRHGVDVRGIQRSLWTLGFSARMQGTRYLATAIDLASRDVRLNKQLTSVLYPHVANAHAVNQKLVEHAMRRAIESAWSGGSMEAQYRLFGNTIDAKRGKPTVGEMIAGMAELLRTGMEMDE